METPPVLSVIIPAYNEENRISRTLDSTLTYLQKQPYTWEVIVVDDGSSDETLSVVESRCRQNPDVRLISYRPNAGKGKAVRTGILASFGQYVLFMDADLSTPISEIEWGLPWVQQHGYDIAIGSRGMGESDVQVHQPLYREISAWIFKWLYRSIVGIWFIKDTQCGFKFFKGDIARWLFSHQRIDGYMFDIETLYIAHHVGLSIKEFPVAWVNDIDSRLRLFYDTMRMFKHLLSIRCRRLSALKKQSPAAGRLP